MNGDNHPEDCTVAASTGIAVDAVQAAGALPYPAKPAIPAVRGGTDE